MKKLLMAAIAAAVVATSPASAKPRHKAYDHGNVIGGRPSGCPYEFCGCEASLYIFGVIHRDLNLASNWIRKFPRAHPAPGMAAARNHHVMVLIRHVSGRDWLVHDGNSGHHLIHEHVRSIAGYVIVNPHGSRFSIDHSAKRRHIARR